MEWLHALTFNFIIKIGFLGLLWIFTLLKDNKTAGQHLITYALKEKPFAWFLGKKKRDEMGIEWSAQPVCVPDDITSPWRVRGGLAPASSWLWLGLACPELHEYAAAPRRPTSGLG